MSVVNFIISLMLLGQGVDVDQSQPETRTSEWLREDECSGPLFCDQRAGEAYERFRNEGGYIPGRTFELVDRCLSVAELRFGRPLHAQWYDLMLSPGEPHVFLTMTPARVSISIVTHPNYEGGYIFNHVEGIPSFQCRFDVGSSDPPFIIEMR